MRDGRDIEPTAAEDTTPTRADRDMRGTAATTEVVRHQEVGLLISVLIQQIDNIILLHSHISGGFRGGPRGGPGPRGPMSGGPRGRGGPRPGSKEPLKFEGEFDFESANAKFDKDEIEKELKKLTIGDSKDFIFFKQNLKIYTAVKVYVPLQRLRATMW